MCKAIFTVQDVAQVPILPASRAEPLPPVETAPRSRTDAPNSESRSGNISDFVPVLAAGSAPPKSPPPITPPREVKWNELDKPIPVAKPAPVETTWTPDGDAPKAKPTTILRETPYEPAELLPNVPNRKRRRGFRILLALIVFVVAGLGTGGYFLYRYIALGPERTMAAAHDFYKEGRYDQARKTFEKLSRDYPSNFRVPEARFFTDLSGLRHESNSVMNRSDPKPALTQWKQLLETLKEPEIATFGDKKRFGIDVAEAGTKLVEDLLGKAKDVYDRDKPEACEEWLGEAAAIDRELERFRPDEVGKPESITREFAALRKQLTDAKDQLALLNEAKKLLAEPDDEKIAAAKRYGIAQGLANDERFNALLDQAEKQIQAKAIYTKQEPLLAPTAIPDDGLTSLLFAPSLIRGQRQPLQGPPQVFFALARGVLYALSEVEGNVLWAMRTGIDCNIMPVRVAATDQHGDMVLVASSLGGKHGVSARSPNDGRPLWHQVLPAECKGQPVVFGGEAYVALNDATGTIVQISLATGELLGRITVGRPLGSAMALRPQSGYLYVPAEARAVYVFDLDKRGPNAERLDPAFMGVMTTGHAPGTLRTAPVFANPDPDAPGTKKFLILGQVDGPDAMKLRVFPMLLNADGTVDNSGAPTEIALNGWSSFLPHCDGESLAIVTDQGTFGLFGLSLAGNSDPAIFNFPPPTLKTSRNTATARGQIVHAMEGSYWLIARGQLHRLRFGLSGDAGLRLIPYGEPVSVGDPIHAAQVGSQGEILVVVTQDGQTCRATAIDANTSEIRWRRELGLMVKGSPVPLGNAALFMDQAGGFYRVEAEKLAERGNAAWLVDERWMLKPPISGFAAITDLIRGPNGSAFAVMVGNVPGEEAKRFLIRRYNGTTVDEYQAPTPALLAGQPTLAGDCLLLPLTNGTLYRVNLTDFKGLEEGPSWRGERLPSTSKCFLTPLNTSEFVASDGGKGLMRWGWAPGSKLFEARGRITLSEKVDAHLVTLPGEKPTKFLLADAKGNLTVWDGDRFNPPALRNWRANAKGGLPQGTVALGLTYAAPHVLALINQQWVALDPNSPEPRWISPPIEKLVAGAPVFTAEELVLSEQAGVVRSLDLKTGQFTAKKFVLPASYGFAAAAVPVGPKHLLLPLTDGTLLFGEIGTMKANQP